MKVFNELGQRIECSWRAANYAELAFPDIAQRLLADANLPKTITPWDVVRWLGRESQLPRQSDIEALFGNPPITLYSGPRFFIDIYFWVDGTTDIHQHSFAGAFQVLTGSSIHSRYSFRKDREVNQHFHIGQVTFETVELLREGDIRLIVPGAEHIHSLFHLDRPSATITVRTFALPANQPQYTYHKPYLAVDPFDKEPSVLRKLQTVMMLLKVQQPNCDELISELIATSDLHATFLMLRTVFLHLTNNTLEEVFRLSVGRDRFDRIVATALRTHGDLIDYVLPVIEEQGRMLNIIHRRQFITSPEHRFFLALILNVPSRAKLLDLVGQRFPAKDPIDTVLDWVTELSTTKVWASNEPNVLGLAGFGDHHLFVLECLLRDYAGEQINTAITSQYSPEQAAIVRREFEGIALSLRESALFHSLFPG
jgi:hypothetical protein